MEAATSDPPTNNFLHAVRELCRKHGTVFILDEMITGFRWHNGGAQTYFDIDPDLCTFGKGMGNGFAVAAVVGKREIMEHGGLRHNTPRVFLLSATHGAENHALAAARVVMKTYREEPVIERIWRAGRDLIAGLNEAARAAGVGGTVRGVRLSVQPLLHLQGRERRPIGGLPHAVPAGDGPARRAYQLYRAELRPRRRRGRSHRRGRAAKLSQSMRARSMATSTRSSRARR